MPAISTMIVGMAIISTISIESGLLSPDSMIETSMTNPTTAAPKSFQSQLRLLLNNSSHCCMVWRWKNSIHETSKVITYSNLRHNLPDRLPDFHLQPLVAGDF